jgi:flagellar M-ring protein FliF
MNFFQKIAAVWRNVSIVQRALLLAILLTLIVAGVLLTHWAKRPDMRMLYQDLDPEEASKITEKISEQKIAYGLRDGGTSIYAPKEHIYQLRLDMAKEGLPAGGQSGYKIFDNEKIGVSPFVQNINLKRALEEELAKSIQMIDGVSYTRIHIVDTERKLFASQKEETSASVVLQMKPGFSLGASNVAAITHLVAGAVDGLTSERVTVIDSQGRLLSRHSDQATDKGAGTVADYRERVEENLARKAEEMLTTVLGPGRATVKVSAVIDMTSKNFVTEIYDPTTKVPTKEEIKSNSETEGSSTSAEGEPAVQGGVKKDETIVTEYVVGKTVEQKVELPGVIKSLSVAAFVDLSPADANEASAEGQNAMIMELSEVEQVIKNALGLKETDSLKVVHAKFHRPAEVQIDEEASGGLDFVAIAGQASLGIMAICALLVLKVFSGASKKGAVATAGAGQLPAGEGVGGLLPGGGEGDSESVMLRKQIAGTLQSDPEQVRQLFTSWLVEKE